MENEEKRMNEAALKFVSLITGKSEGEIESRFQESVEEKQKNVRLISESEVIDAVSNAFVKEHDMLIGLTLGGRICSRVVEYLFDRQEGEE